MGDLDAEAANDSNMASCSDLTNVLALYPCLAALDLALLLLEGSSFNAAIRLFRFDLLVEDDDIFFVPKPAPPLSLLVELFFLAFS
jgi:hypothetical protein